MYLHYICIFGLHLVYLSVLLPRVDLDPGTIAKMRKLISPACTFGELEVFRLLVEGVVDVLACKKGSKMPLNDTYGNRYQQGARILVECGEDVLVVNNHGIIPLYNALP